MRWLTAALVALAVVVLSDCHKSEMRQERTRPTRCIPPNPCFPSRQMIAELAANLTGQLYQPSDAGYAALVASTNARVTRHPSIVVVAQTEADVQKAVLFARRNFLMLTFTGNNGGYTEGMYEDASLQINLSQLNSVSTSISTATGVQDPGTVTAGAGVTWAQLYNTVAGVNRYVAGASVSPYPIGSAIQGGGTGPLSRSLGLISDSLLSMRLVTMDGSLLEVSPAGATITYPNGVSRFTTVDPGLWNAARGAGGSSFGVATSFTLKMNLRVGVLTQVAAKFVLYQNGQFVGRDTLKYLIPFVTSLPNEWGGNVYLSGVASPTNVGEKGSIEVELLHNGVYNSASYAAINDLLNYDASGTRVSLNVRNYTNVDNFLKSAQLDDLPANRQYDSNTLISPAVLQNSDKLDELVDTLLLVLNNPTVDSYYLCSLELMGGAISSTNRTSLVTAALTNAALSLDIMLLWNDDGIRDDLMLNHAIGMGKKFKAFGSGTVLAYGQFEDEDNWKQTLYGKNYGELLRVKRKHDIDNYLWCHNCVASDFRLHCRRGCEKHEHGDHGSHESDEEGHSQEREPLENLFRKANVQFMTRNRK